MEHKSTKEIKKLQSIHNLEVVPEENSNEILALMEKISATPSGKEYLINNYSGSRKNIFPRTLSFLLSQWVNTEENFDLLLILLNNLETEDKTTSINLNTAIRKSIINNGLPREDKANKLIISFLIKCLEKDDLEIHSALQSLDFINEEKKLDHFIFDPIQFEKTKSLLRNIEQKNDELFKYHLDGLKSFYSNQ